MKKYKFFLLDADHTLLDFEGDARAAVLQTMQEFGIPYTDDQYPIYQRCNNACWQALENKEITKDELSVKRFRDFFDVMGFCADAEKVAARYPENIGEVGGRLLPETLQTIKALYQKGAQMYILSNGFAKSHNMRMERSGILPYLKADFVSENLGAEKPDKLFFDRAFAQIPDFCIEKAIMVGDSLSADMRGGIAAGVDTCWFNPTKANNILKLPITMQIQHLTDLVQLVEDIQ